MRLQHIGIVVASIDQQAPYYQEHWGLALVQGKTFDPLQDVFVAFLQGEGSTTQLELIEPASESSPVANALKRGGGLNHLCYAVTNLEQTLARLREKGAIVVRPPAPAVAFAGRRIAFVYTRQREFVELLEESQ